jgi:methionine-rich copper-binding protein CopC
MTRIPGLSAACLVLGLAAAAPAAWGHAIVVDSRPAPLGHVPAGPLSVMLRYNSRIDAGRSKLLLRQGEASQRLTVDPAAPPDLLRAEVVLAPGQYELVWQVLAIDGHVTRGRVPFTADAIVGAGNGAGAVR